MDAITVLAIESIISDPNIRSGRPIIAGTSLRVQDVIARHLYHQDNPDELAQLFQISLAQVHAALAYYYDHAEAIEAQIRQDDAEIQQAKEAGFGQVRKALL